MKKKILILGIVILAVAGGIHAGVKVTTSCGKGVNTVGPEYFQNNIREFNDYLQELNEIHCGGPGQVSFVSDGPLTLVF